MLRVFTRVIIMLGRLAGSDVDVEFFKKKFGNSKGMTECPILCECVVFIKTKEKASSLLNECSEFGVRSATFSRSGKSAVHLVCCVTQRMNSQPVSSH
ncbi:hypothetical protein CDAR_594781 [Caerostris darwini]|uniref:Uncharacterized protein n=1 Tax=Caerostris darwini TaxID=1538125 RepID=A0AAV4P8C1_9ARAC|nr:hypothetical protein CDAR_594781 [Caerostris darwini]